MSGHVEIVEHRRCAACGDVGPCELARLEYRVEGGTPELRHHVWWRCLTCGDNASGPGQWIGAESVRERYDVAPCDLPTRTREDPQQGRFL